MTFAKELANQLYPTKEWGRVFWASRIYLEDRADFMRDVRKEMFAAPNQVPVELQEKMIKQAVTAISFGARAKGVGWRSLDGDWTNPALVDIIKNGVQRHAFLSSVLVQNFIKEQSLLDNYLAIGMKEELPMLYFGPLITRNVKPSKSKAVAYLYQHAEVQVMQTAIEVLARYSIKPIALIHDAFVVRNKLSVDLRDEIRLAIQSNTGNKFWSLKPTQLDGFRY